eukprot:04754_2
MRVYWNSMPTRDLSYLLGCTDSFSKRQMPWSYSILLTFQKEPLSNSKQLARSSWMSPILEHYLKFPSETLSLYPRETHSPLPMDAIRTRRKNANQSHPSVCFKQIWRSTLTHRRTNKEPPRKPAQAPVPHQYPRRALNLRRLQTRGTGKPTILKARTFPFSQEATRRTRPQTSTTNIHRERLSQRKASCDSTQQCRTRNHTGRCCSRPTGREATRCFELCTPPTHHRSLLLGQLLLNLCQEFQARGPLLEPVRNSQPSRKHRIRETKVSGF